MNAELDASNVGTCLKVGTKLGCHLFIGIQYFMWTLSIRLQSQIV